MAASYGQDSFFMGVPLAVAGYFCGLASAKFATCLPWGGGRFQLRFSQNCGIIESEYKASKHREGGVRIHGPYPGKHQEREKP